MVATKAKNVELVELLLEHWADNNVKDNVTTLNPNPKPSAPNPTGAGKINASILILKIYPKPQRAP